MRLNTRARYALRCLVEIQRGTTAGRPVSLETVARRTRISHRYLEQLAISLREARLLRGVRGRNGGYVLTRPAAQIRVGEIVQAVIGPINIVDCIAHPAVCLIADVCECRRVYSAINRGLIEAMNAYSLADLKPDRPQETAGPAPAIAAGNGVAPSGSPARPRVHPCGSA